MSNFTFFHNVFYAICILKSFSTTFQSSPAAFLDLGGSKNGLKFSLRKRLQEITTHVLCCFVSVSGTYFAKEARYSTRYSSKFGGRWKPGAIEDPGMYVFVCLQNCHHLTLSQTSLCFDVSVVQVFQNTVGKREIACNEQFLLFTQYFLPFGELSNVFIKFKVAICKLSVW